MPKNEVGILKKNSNILLCLFEKIKVTLTKFFAEFRDTEFRIVPRNFR
jgi:hypothetical protein